MKRNQVQDIDRGHLRIRQDLKLLGGSFVKIGVQEDTTRQDLDGVTDMVVVAAAHEFGTPDIDQRSFIRATRDETAAETDSLIAAEKDAVLAGKKTPEQSLNALGLYMTAKIQAKIHSNIPPALSPATIRRKGSSVALIDSGQMVQSIRQVVHLGGRGNPRRVA